MPEVPAIVVHMPSEKATATYARYSWETMRSLANKPDNLRLVVHSIGPTAGARLSDLPRVSYVETQTLQEGKGLGGSWGHACCIMHALSLSSDGDLHVICDSDTVVVAKGWDDYVRRRLLIDGLGIIGTTYEEVGGFSSGTSDVQTYKRIPTFTWAAFNPKHDWRSLSVLPDKNRNVAITNEALARTYNLPVGHSVFGEAGWQVPQFLTDNGITYDGWAHLKGTKDAVVLKGLSDYNEEYHAQGVPFVVHQRGSLRHAFREDKMSKRFYEVTDAWNATEKDRASRWSWDSVEPLTVYVHGAMKSAYELALDTVATRPAAPTPATVTVSNGVTAASQFALASASKEVGTTTIAGWVKATLDDRLAWSRHVSPVPSTIDMAFERTDVCRYLRLEGTVTQACVALPAVAMKPYTLVVRNLTAGAVKCKVVGAARSVEVPADTNYLIIIDIDGAARVE